MKKGRNILHNYNLLFYFLVFLLFLSIFLTILPWQYFWPFLAVFLPITLFIYWISALFPFGKVERWQGDRELLKSNLIKDWGNLWIFQEKLDFLWKEILAKKDEELNLLKDEKQRRFWKSSWESYLDQIIALNTLTLRYQDFYLLNYYEDKELHALAFLIAYLSYLYQYDAILKILEIVKDKEDLKDFFNTSDYFQDLKLSALDELLYSLTKWENLIRWRVGNLYFKFLRYKGFFVYPVFKEKGKGFIKSVYRLHKNLKKKLRKNKLLFLKNPFRFLRNYGLAFLYPVQKNVAQGVSFVRFTERDYLINNENIKEAEKLLEPGDIMLERRNWHLTNVGIPGFWPHAALYLGDFEKFSNYFRELEEDFGETIEHYLKKNYPDFYEFYSSANLSVIEAVRDGVILQSLFESAHADYWGVMRPRLSKKEKFIALTRAIEHWGKGYDYQFDFKGEDNLVCSELVYKSYMPSDEMKGLNFILEEVAGNPLLSPNNIAKKFSDEYGKEKQELDFVLFLDGSEEKQEAVFKDEDEFKKTWKRTKWDILQE